MKTIDWKDWEIFCRVVEGGGFTQGAELAQVPKTSASAAVARLGQPQRSPWMAQ